jgi:4-diphosphocytidyl-2-C-methyl-D-erythritol kinase
MRIFCPAKINLHLRVGPLGADGYHPLLSWMCTVGLFDTLDFFLGKEPGISLTCDRPDLPIDKSNLVLRAAQALAAKGGAKPTKMTLEKKIPLGGGLGGGSCDAAATLLALNKLWQTNLPSAELEDIGASLGSDVPFFFHQPSSLCFGRGEQIISIPSPKPKFAVLMFPEFPMATAAVYHKFDEMKLGTDLDAQAPLGGTELNAEQLLPLLVNDLEPPAFALALELGRIRDRLQRELARVVRMSGSGSTLFTLADNKSEADEAAARARKAGFKAGAYELAPAQAMVLA